MIVRKLKDLLGTPREVKAETWTSRRFLLAEDQMGFSMHDTLIKAGTKTQMWYQHHLEAVYCVSGKGELEDLVTGQVYPIEDGTFYALDQHDKHILTGHTDMRMICVFNPPLTGLEVHDETGAYPAMPGT
jgi:L-ectoine synthase